MLRGDGDLGGEAGLGEEWRGEMGRGDCGFPMSDSMEKACRLGREGGVVEVTDMTATAAVILDYLCWHLVKKVVPCLVT